MNARRPPHHERRALLLALAAAAPAMVLALVASLSLPAAPRRLWLWGALAVGAWLWGAFALRAHVARALNTITNLLGALRDGDFAVRGRTGEDRRDALGEALAEINGLAETMGRARAGALEAGALLGKVIAEIDVAVFAFDSARKLRLCNRAAERLLTPARSDAPRVPLLGAAATDLGVAELLEGETPRTIEAAFPGAEGQWQLWRSSFRLDSLAHELLVLTDLRRALREEERQAWQRIVRVLGHEINNSLAPLRSIASDLGQSLRVPVQDRAADWEDDFARGLAVIERRAEALGRFMNAYARLAKLPPPRFEPIDVRAWLRRIVEVERRVNVVLTDGPGVTILGDGDQLDQLAINLVQNGVDAALETNGQVEVSWQKLAREIEIVVADEGPGVADTHNLFVPFFTTKPQGSGIGLALSRQIAEAHRGTLTLETRRDRRGALARLRLPL